MSNSPEKPRCGGCDHPVDELFPCVWDTTLEVGKCCETYIDTRCPDCGSDDLDFREYDFGVCSETGYHDAGVRAICRACGSENDERDTEVKIGPSFPVQPALFKELERKPAKMEKAGVPYTPTTSITPYTPPYAAIGNGLFVRVGSRKSRKGGR
jgi:hypothetical protein